jgi:replicative DNA helicase
MREAGKLDEAGGPSYIAHLLDTPYPSAMPHFSKKLREYATRRQLIVTCHEISKSAYNTTDDVSGVISAAQDKMLGIDASKAAADSICTMYDLTQQSIDRYQAAREDREIKAVPTGFPTLDRLTGGGFRGSKLIIIAARPGIGKTALMLNMASNMAQRGHMVGIFSLEMDKEELDDRWMSAETGISSLRLISGMGEGEWKRVVSVAENKSTWPILVDDTGNLPAHELKRRARKMVQMGAKIIFIDQLSRLKGYPNKNTWESNTQNVADVGAMKKELRLPIVLLAQVSRKAEETASKKPSLATLKMTGALEEDADLILLGHRDFAYTKDEAYERRAEWELAKHRQGPTWNIIMDWDAKRTRFTEEANL